MKKIILFLLLTLTLFASEEQIYFGVGGGYSNESFNNDVDAKASGNLARFKFGYGIREAYAIEFSIDYIDTPANIFSENDQAKYGMNVEVIKGFDFDLIVPFFKAGFGAGFQKVDLQFNDKINYGTFNLGAGTYIPLGDNFDLEICYEYKYVTYEAINIISDTLEYESNLNNIYFGINTRF